MTVMSERWMERFFMNPQVLCLDGLTSDDDPEDRSSDVDGEDGVFEEYSPVVFAGGGGGGAVAEKRLFFNTIHLNE